MASLAGWRSAAAKAQTPNRPGERSSIYGGIFRCKQQYFLPNGDSGVAESHRVTAQKGNNVVPLAPARRGFGALKRRGRRPRQPLTIEPANA